MEYFSKEVRRLLGGFVVAVFVDAFVDAIVIFVGVVVVAFVLVVVVGRVGDDWSSFANRARDSFVPGES